MTGRCFTGLAADYRQLAADNHQLMPLDDNHQLMTEADNRRAGHADREVTAMNKNSFAPTPPMGWNSYDYYDTTVTEDQVKANADVMAARLKQYGWEYVVVDIQWYAYDTGSKRDMYQYIPFWKVEMDEYSRLLPCPDRFPSSAGGKGFRPLADYVHIGLKFGIYHARHPRIAAHNRMKIKGADVTADEIADPYSICRWNPDMYGLNVEADGAQQYYDSLFELYAQWGVDFVKVDDICRHDMPSAKREIEMIHHAIRKCGRPIVLSLSPGPRWWTRPGIIRNTRTCGG